LIDKNTFEKNTYLNSITSVAKIAQKRVKLNIKKPKNTDNN
jgi:hypothetical protein